MKISLCALHIHCWQVFHYFLNQVHLNVIFEPWQWGMVTLIKPQLLFNQRLQLFVQSPQPFLLIFAWRNQMSFPIILVKKQMNIRILQNESPGIEMLISTPPADSSVLSCVSTTADRMKISLCALHIHCWQVFHYFLNQVHLNGIFKPWQWGMVTLIKPQLFFNQRLQLFVQSPQPYLLIFAWRN